MQGALLYQKDSLAENNDNPSAAAGAIGIFKTNPARSVKFSKTPDSTRPDPTDPTRVQAGRVGLMKSAESRLYLSALRDKPHRMSYNWV